MRKNITIELSVKKLSRIKIKDPLSDIHFYVLKFFFFFFFRHDSRYGRLARKKKGPWWTMMYNWKVFFQTRLSLWKINTKKKVLGTQWCITGRSFFRHDSRYGRITQKKKIHGTQCTTGRSFFRHDSRYERLVRRRRSIVHNDA